MVVRKTDAHCSRLHHPAEWRHGRYGPVRSGKRTASAPCLGYCPNPQTASLDPGTASEEGYPDYVEKKGGLRRKTATIPRLKTLHTPRTLPTPPLNIRPARS